MRSSQSGGRRRKLLLVCGSLLLTLLVLEGGLRLTGLSPGLDPQYSYFVPDPDLPYITHPGKSFSGTARSGEFDYEYAHNSRGFRDAEIEIPKPPRTFRILALGDSFTYGAGAKANESWPNRLETVLNETRPLGPDIDVVNAGIPRFFAATQRLLLEAKALDTEPDLIIAGFIPNDVMDTYMGVDAIAVDPSGHLLTSEGAALGRAGSFLFINSAVARVLLRRWVDRKLRGRYDVDWPKIFEDDGIYEPAWQQIEAEYANIARIGQSIGARFALLHIPLDQATTRKMDVDPTYPAERLAAWCEANGVIWIDALPLIASRWDEEELYWPIDGHSTPAGYAIIAEAAVAALERAGAVPRAALEPPE